MTNEMNDKLAAAARDAEANRDAEIDWVRNQETAKGPSAVYSVRIPVNRIEELRELAAARGIPPTSLIRTWVLTQLDAAKDADDYTQRWARDVRETTDHLRELLDQRPLADAS